MRYGWLAPFAVVAQLAAPSLLADPPARVGRLNLISGTVSFRPAGINDWMAAEPNRTLTIGDALWTDAGSRAEVHAGSTAIRLSEQTELDFLNLDDQTVQVRLAQGTVTVRIRVLYEGQVYEIDTPNGAVSLASAGEYRIESGADGTQSKVTVWSGDAEVTAAGSSFQVNAQQFAMVNGTDAPTFDLADVGPRDDWDTWCVERDRREDGARSVQYVSREMPGYEDLDDYGHWALIAGYGNVWIPDRVGPGWAPYHTGHWVWTGPWGWTWVDEAPWGYAPYHYGRWAYVQAHWVWSPRMLGIPMTVVARPVFAPALVAFIGGPHWRLSFGVGNDAAVGWVPLGPGEVYRPAYQVSETYIRQVNVTNVTNVTNITVVNNTTINNTNITTYRNANVPGAVMAMPQSGMVTGQAVARVAIRLDHQQLASAPAAGSGPLVAPTTQSLVGVLGAPGGHIAAPPAAVANRHVMAVVAPPLPVVPFSAKQQAIAANGGRPLSAQVEAQMMKTGGPGFPASTPLVKPAAVSAGNVGLKPARSGLPVVESVKSTSAGGFVPHELAAQHNAVTDKAKPALTVTNSNVGQPGGTGNLGGAHAGTGGVTHTPVPSPVMVRRFVAQPVVNTPTPTPKGPDRPNVGQPGGTGNLGGAHAGTGGVMHTPIPSPVMVRRFVAQPVVNTPTPTPKGPDRPNVGQPGGTGNLGGAHAGIGGVMHTPVPSPVMVRRFVAQPVAKTPTPTPKGPDRPNVVHPAGPVNVVRPQGQGMTSHPPSPTPVQTKHPVTEVRRAPTPKPTPTKQQS